MRRDLLGRLPVSPVWPSWLPRQGALGLVLVAVAWPASWLQIAPLAEFAFFPLWLGYILMVDALVLRHTGASRLTGNPLAFGGMFLASIPLWWAFEGINYFTQNWHYLGAETYSPLKYTLVASWHFSIVVPAVFETADLVGSFRWVQRWQRGPALPVSRPILIAAIALGLLSLAAVVFWPRYAFSVTWLSLFLLLDPINHFWGRPSILAQLRRGDWRTVVAFGLGALVCGWFWEMWNYWASPKWEYSIPFVEFAKVFEMPLLGYGGYLAFGLETYAAYHFLGGVVERARKYPFRSLSLEAFAKPR